MKAVTVACVAALLCSGAAAVQGETAELDRLREERAAVEARFQSAREACEQRFAVTGCVEEARRDRRAALQALRSREAAIDGAQRARRAEQRRQAVRAKVEAQAAREAATPAATSASRPAERRAPTPSMLRARPPASAPDPATRAADEAHSRAVYEARQQEIERHREEVARRNAKRLQAGKPAAAPLPIPASAPR